MSWEAAASIAGPVIGGLMGQGAASSANATNIKLKNLERYDAQNAHRYQVEDMRLAGLNPLLSAGGGGSSTASAGSVQPVDQLAKGLERSTSNAVDARRLRKELDATNSQVSLNKAAERTQATQAELNTSNAIASKTTAETNALRNAALKSQLPSIAARAKSDLRHAQIDAEWANQDAVLKRAGNVTGAVGNLFGIGKFLKDWGKKPNSRSSGYSEEHWSQQGEHMGTKVRKYLD